METQTYSHRELELLDALRRLGGSARSAELAKLLDVSEETVRRVIKSLSHAGLVERVHGGAYLTDGRHDPSFISRITQNAAEKKIAARQAATLVRDGMTVFLDVGTTTAFVADEMTGCSDLIVVTNSISVAQSLIGQKNNRVHLLGGEIHTNERGTFGHVTEKQARRYVYDLAFFSTDAVSAERGFLYLNQSEAALTEVVADCSDRRVVVADHYKFDASAPYCGLSPKLVEHVVTDQAPSDTMTAALTGWDIQTLFE